MPSYRLHEKLTITIEWDDELGWLATVQSEGVYRCGNGLEHPYNLLAHRRFTWLDDPTWLDTFEWAIRGKRSALIRIASALIDHQLEHTDDPCVMTENP